MIKLARITAVSALALLVLASGASSDAATRLSIPTGLRLAHWEHMAGGLDYLRIARGGAKTAQNINIARLEPSDGLALRTVVSNGAIAGQGKNLEPTSSMCRRVKCLVAINGDFFQNASGVPVGGIAGLGQAIRSPDPSHVQLGISPDGTMFAGRFSWDAGATLSDGRSISFDGVNVPLRGGKISLYTAAYGPTTRNGKGNTEIRARIIDPPGPLLLGQTATVRLTDIRHVGDAPLPKGGAVLAGNGAGGDALDALWSDISHGRVSRDIQVSVLSPHDMKESIGGNPLLLRNGRRAFKDDRSNRIKGRHPRTLVGWNPTGEVFLATVDGRKPGYAEGLTMGEAADLMLRLGATDAINLDGGGSTTFVTHGGRVTNSPSDVRVRRGGKVVLAKETAPGDRIVGAVERPVATALAIVRVPIVKHKPSKSFETSNPAALLRALRDEQGQAYFPALLPALPPHRDLPYEPVGIAVVLSGTCSVLVGATVRRRLRRSV